MYWAIATVIFALSGLHYTSQTLLKRKRELQQDDGISKQKKDEFALIIDDHIDNCRLTFKYISSRFLDCVKLSFFGIFLGIFYYFCPCGIIFLCFVVIYLFLSVWIIVCGYKMMFIYGLTDNIEDWIVKMRYDWVIGNIKSFSKTIQNKKSKK